MSTRRIVLPLVLVAVPACEGPDPSEDSDADSDAIVPTRTCLPVYPATTGAVTVDWSRVTEDTWGDPLNPTDINKMTLHNLRIPPEDASERLCTEELPFYEGWQVASLGVMSFDNDETSLLLTGDRVPNAPVEGLTLVLYLMVNEPQIPYRELAIALIPSSEGSSLITLE